MLGKIMLGLCASAVVLYGITLIAPDSPASHRIKALDQSLREKAKEDAPAVKAAAQAARSAVSEPSHQAGTGNTGTAPAPSVKQVLPNPAKSVALADAQQGGDDGNSGNSDGGDHSTHSSQQVLTVDGQAGQILERIRQKLAKEEGR